jgi:hypothetical protein
MPNLKWCLRRVHYWTEAHTELQYDRLELG